jgi:peptide-methionine (R)-S-oxide reductase
MMTRRFLVIGGAALAAGASWPTFGAPAGQGFEVVRTDEEWQALLTADRYAILRRSATERPFTSPLLKQHRPGIFA